MTHPLTDALFDIKPVIADPQGSWIALTEEGALLRIHPIGCTHEVLARLVSKPAKEDALSLCLSPCGEMAAVVQTKGRYGWVIHLGSGRITMTLDRKDYFNEHCVFPCAFFVLNGQLRLIHGTDWNRLDISDPYTGQLLTPRSPTSFQQGEDPPEHYLDYFHCGLTVSPDQDWLVDNGWVWHPFGIATSWSLRKWIIENVWESEDGDSKQGLCCREYYWDGPLCWVGNRTIAVWGQGDDKCNLFAAVRIFNVETGEELHWFPGPKGNLAFDEYLFSYSQEHGTAVWDIKTGDRLLYEPSLRPVGYHPGNRTFLSVGKESSFILSRLKENPV